MHGLNTTGVAGVYGLITTGVAGGWGGVVPSGVVDAVAVPMVGHDAETKTTTSRLRRTVSLPMKPSLCTDGVAGTGVAKGWRRICRGLCGPASTPTDASCFL